MPSHFFDVAAAAAFSEKKMTKINLFESPHMFCDVYGLEPGQAQTQHVHEGSDKVYFALRGTCVVAIGQDKRELHPGELAVAPSGMAHSLSNESGDRATLLVMMAPHPSFKG